MKKEENFWQCCKKWLRRLYTIDTVPNEPMEERPVKLIVGLGNIGREYANTKHNIGFMVADELAKRWKVSFDKNDRHAMYAEYRTPERVALIKPTTYMNLSGVAVGEWANFYHIDVEDIAIISDDMDIPVGTIRIRKKGSAGGHNGLKSVGEHLGTMDFPRFKIGIGHPAHENKAVISHVLNGFSGDDKTTIEAAVKTMADAVECWLKEDIDVTMNRFNTKKEKKKKEPKQAETTENKAEAENTEGKAE